MLYLYKIKQKGNVLMKKRKNKIIVLAIVLVLIVLVGICFLIKYQTYNYVEITTIFENQNTDNANYVNCLDGILKYSRDGVVLLSEKGDEIWNQPCQMNNPIVEQCGESVAVGDKGGTSILVFQRKGLKGEIHTAKTIEQFSVSSQGIVSAILKDEEAPLVMCYDAVGNKLVEHKVVPKNIGYPTDVAISEDGYTLLVSYIYIEENKVENKISYYYFNHTETKEKDYQVYEKDFENMIIPEVAFLKNDISVLFGDSSMILYKGLKEPKKLVQVEFQNEVQNVTYDDELIAVLLRKDKSVGYKLNIYDTKGKLLSSVDVDKEYEKLSVSAGQIILYDGQACCIFSKNGVKKYEGNIEQKIMQIDPMQGLNKYMVINASGFYEVRLVK